MAKSRYSPELQEKICNAIAVYGLDEAGWTAGEISKATFYDWLKKYSDFSAAVSGAKTEYRKSSREATKRLANKAFVDYLNGAMTKVSHIRKEAIAPSGEIVQLEEWRTVPVGIPKWAIDRALGGDLTEIEALSRLAELGMVPAWVVDCAQKVLDKAREEIATILRAELPEPLAYELTREREHSGGISEKTFNRIRAEIMGIDEQHLLKSASEVVES